MVWLFFELVLPLTLNRNALLGDVHLNVILVESRPVGANDQIGGSLKNVRPRRPAWARHRSRGHTEARQDPHLQAPPEGKNADENEPIHGLEPPTCMSRKERNGFRASRATSTISRTALSLTPWDPR